MYWPLQENVIGDTEKDILIGFIRNATRYTQFTKVREFEEAYAEWQGCKYCVFVNSGSSANLLILSAVAEQFGWNSGDEIIVPALTWPTTITPVVQLGFTPVFVDANLVDLSFDYDQLARRLTPKTRAIFIAHILGFPADVKRIQEIVRGKDVVLLEDTCETQGGEVEGVKVGNFGLASSFSFYWGHHMTTIEGGMVCTDDESLYKRLILKRSHGLARELPGRYHEEIKREHEGLDFNFLFLTDGFNLRSTELNAVLGISQLEKLDSFILARNANYERFYSICQGYTSYLTVLKASGMSSFVFPFILRNRCLRIRLQEYLGVNGIESRPLISGNLLRQPFLKNYYDKGAFENADFLHECAFYIGNNQFVSEDRLAHLQSILKTFFDGGVDDC